MAAEYKSKDLQQLFNKSNETIRVWSHEFAEYLSPTATPGEGRHRLYSAEDLRVLALVNEMRNKGSQTEDIHLALKAGSRMELPEATVERALTLQSSIELDRALDRIGNLELQLADAHTQINDLEKQLIKANTRLELKSEQDDDRTDLQTEIARLNREMGKLEAKLEMMQDQNNDAQDPD